jgi:histidinol phosphatase-like enzyme (inositol monophosphatase family)
MNSGPLSDELAEYLAFGTDLATEAGKVTLRYFRRGIAIDHKPDSTPVTIADRETECLIRSAINRRYPQHGILGEEYGESNPGARWRWTVDPVDGTEAFIHGVPLYTVLIALQCDGESVLGVIHCPPLHETVAAAVGCGCTYNERRCEVSQVDDLTQARVNVTDYADLMKRNPRFATKLLSTVRMCRGWGDAYSYLLVATGRAEVGLDPVANIWDWAPLKPIIEEAGGRFTDFKGAQTVQAGSVLASNRLLHDRLLDMAKLDLG